MTDLSDYMQTVSEPYRKKLEARVAELEADNARLRAARRGLHWQSFDASCPNCGDDAEVLTTSELDRCAHDGDEARCDSCRHPGYVSVDPDNGASISWHDDPKCACEWCKLLAASDIVDRLPKKGGE